MQDKKVHAVLFDFGGVIAEEGFANGLNRLADQQNLKVANMPEEGMMAVYDSGFVLGHGTEADFWQLLRQRTHLQGDDAYLTEQILSGFVIREWMMHVVRKLRASGYITAILSDQTHWLNELDQRNHFIAEFDHIYNSYNLGKGKQDASLFIDVARNLGVKTENILFIDDNKNNTQRAENMGMETIVYRNKDDFIHQLNRVLNEPAHF